MDGNEEDLGAFADARDALVEQVQDGRRKAMIKPVRRGRPKGATNRKTAEFEEFYREKGYQDPLIGLADFSTMNPVELQAWFERHERAVVSVGKRVVQALPSLLDIIKAQNAARAELAPYLHGKQPIRVKVEDERLPVLVLNLGTNQLDQAKLIEGRRAFSIGQPIEGTSSDINTLEDTEK